MTRSHRIYFDHWAGKYDRDLGSFDYAVPDALAQILTPMVPPNAHILDVGIGTGLVSTALKGAMPGEADNPDNPGVRISGIDTSGRMLDICRGRGFEDVHLCDAGTQIWPYPEKTFDVAVAAGLLEFIENPAWFMAQGARILKSGGILAIAFETIESLHLYKPGLLRGVIRNTGECATIRRIHYTPLPRVYNKYLHNPWYVEQVAGKMGLVPFERKTGTAYRRPNGDAVQHDIIVFRKA